MKKATIDIVLDQLDLIWKQNSVPADLSILVREMIRLGQSNTETAERSLHRWSGMPFLCFYAAGGSGEEVTSLVAAWFAFYLAAHLMDNIQDRELPATIRQDIALNTASILFFSAELLLNQLDQAQGDHSAARDISRDFNRTLLEMCTGQHIDLITGEPDLERYYQASAKKSGNFFALACRAGARLAITNKTKLDGYGKFGFHFGMLVQIIDDLEEIIPDVTSGKVNRVDKLLKSLPVVYARDTLSEQDSHQLKTLLQSDDTALVNQGLNMVEDCGAVLYVLTELERHAGLAREGLLEAKPAGSAREQLNLLLEDLISPAAKF